MGWRPKRTDLYDIREDVGTFNTKTGRLEAIVDWRFSVWGKNSRHYYIYVEVWATERVRTSC